MKAPKSTGPSPHMHWLGRYIFFFVLIASVLYYLFVTNFHALFPYFSFLTGAVYKLLSQFYKGFSWSGNTLTYSTFAFEITRGCDGITPLILIVAAVIPFPATYKAKLRGLLWAVPLLLVVNYLRIVLLALTKLHYPAYFPVMHAIILQPMMVIITFIVFIVWLMTDAKPAK